VIDRGGTRNTVKNKKERKAMQRHADKKGLSLALEQTTLVLVP
jgi:hypothetical protein